MQARGNVLIFSGSGSIGEGQRCVSICRLSGNQAFRFHPYVAHPSHWERVLSCAVAFALISSKETLIGETIFHHTVRNRRAKLEAKGALQKSIIRPGSIRTS